MRPYCVVVVYEDGSMDTVGPFKTEANAEHYAAKRERDGNLTYVRMLLARSRP